MFYILLLLTMLHYLLTVIFSAPSVSVSGLDGSLLENGGNMLAGQRQLLCLARALLQSSRIIFVEQTASPDGSAADAAIHRVGAVALPAEEHRCRRPLALG